MPIAKKLTGADILLKLLAVVLLVSAALKGWELLTVPMAEIDIWSNRAFQIFVVQFEIALGIWLLSGMFKKAAWVAALGCFTAFSFITLYLGLTGAASCGCFGPVKVNPWITLFVMDVPAVILLVIFRPKLELLAYGKSLKSLIMTFLLPLPSAGKFAAYAVVGVAIIVVSTAALILNAPAEATDTYVTLRPQNWPGNELPIFDDLTEAGELGQGNWFVMLFDHTCADCGPAMEQFEQMVIELQGNEDFLRFAFIEIPHERQYGPDDYIPAQARQLAYTTKLGDSREYFVLTPSSFIMSDGQVLKAWHGSVPTLDELLDDIYGGNIGGLL